LNYRDIIDSRVGRPGAFSVSLRNSAEHAPTAMGAVRSISELRGDAKQLGNESGLRDCILFRHPSRSALPNLQVVLGKERGKNEEEWQRRRDNTFMSKCYRTGNGPAMAAELHVALSAVARRTRTRELHKPSRSASLTAYEDRLG
jgi:hypothetical protein